jgi:hypothetical protein
MNFAAGRSSFTQSQLHRIASKLLLESDSSGLGKGVTVDLNETKMLKNVTGPQILGPVILANKLLV